MSDKQRLMQEAYDLREVWEKQSLLVDEFKNLPIIDMYLLYMQHRAMRRYARILVKRINRAEQGER